MSCRNALELAVVAVLLCVAPARAGTLTAVPGPSADGRILSFSGDANEGLGGLLSVYSQPGNVQHTLMQFNLDFIPAGEQIYSATLELFVDEAYGNGNPNNLNMDVHAVTTPWIETEVTWNSASAGVPWNSPGGDFDPFVYSTSTANIPVLDAILWDVTELVRDWHDGTIENHGLLLKSFTGNELHFKSKENSSVFRHPFLLVTFSSPIPEPSSMLLMSVGVIAFVGITRRQRRIAQAS